MNLLERYKKQVGLHEQGLDFAPLERWSVYLEDDKDHFISGNFYFSFCKLGAWLWGKLKVGNKRQWKLIRHEHRFL